MPGGVIVGPLRGSRTRYPSWQHGQPSLEATVARYAVPAAAAVGRDLVRSGYYVPPAMAAGVEALRSWWGGPEPMQVVESHESAGGGPVGDGGGFRYRGRNLRLIGTMKKGKFIPKSRKWRRNRKKKAYVLTRVKRRMRSKSRKKKDYVYVNKLQ